jgi:hypothetical protein
MKFELQSSPGQRIGPFGPLSVRVRSRGTILSALPASGRCSVRTCGAGAVIQALTSSYVLRITGIALV